MRFYIRVLLLLCKCLLVSFLTYLLLQVSKNLPDIAKKTDIAPESIGAKANVRN